MENENRDTWNEMVRFRDNTKDSSLKERAEMLLRQRNTSGGRAVIDEMINFLDQHTISK